MEKKTDQRKLTKHAGRIAILLAVIFLVLYLVTVVAGSSSFFADSAEKNALLYLEEDMERTNALAAVHFDNLYAIADQIAYADSTAAVESIVKSYIGSDQFGDLRYYSQGQSYAPDGTPIAVETSGHELIAALSQSKAAGCTEIYYDSITAQDCMAFFIPIRGSAYVDGLLSILPARNIIGISSVINEKAVSLAVIDESGKVLGATGGESFAVGNNYFQFISRLASDKTAGDRVAACVAENRKIACTISATGTDYTLAIAPIDRFDGHLMLVSMSVSEGLIAPELTYIRHIVNLLAISILALVVGFVYAMLYHKKSQEALSAASLTDARLECPNAEQFRRTAREHVYSGQRRCVVSVLAMHNFHYVSNRLGEANMTELLKFTARTLETFCREGETYGYAGDGNFLLLQQYNGEIALKNKILLVQTVINKNEQIAASGIKLKFDVGIYRAFEGRRRTVQEMIECATAASDYTKVGGKLPYAVYTEEIRREIDHSDRIEAQMENALENGEFRLFLQPKYNVSTDRIDSAEALVRWFDPRRGEYIFPGEFISLFETNGFIVKLDHFIYIQVLEYLSRAAERGEKIVPIAVNVSRVTASSDDFLDFYIGNKRKYRIGDGFITLEFTESFAMEDYEKISDIVTGLHENGMRCSIDDFGSGYSSFHILKQMPMDELKLDRIFIEKGVSEERDDKLLGTVIDLAKSMGMTVVQEGVETKAQFDWVVGKGCDVVQGYYYAKAIPLQEYRVFLDTNTAIKYKALVK